MRAMNGSHMNYSRAAIERDFRRIISKQLGRDAAISPGGALLTGLGLDFLGLLELTVAAEDHFGVRINSRGFSGAYTLDVCIMLLERLVAGREHEISEPVMAEGAD